MHVAILGTYPPTQCGIATFTADVEAALRHHGVKVTIIHVDPADHTVGRFLTRTDPSSYMEAAEWANRNDVDVVLVQHEFGIYGGADGGMLLLFTAALRIPFVVTFHTILSRFTPTQAAVMQEVCASAAAVTVFTVTARQLLLEQEICPAKLPQIVPHGAPVELFDEVDEVAVRSSLGLPAVSPIVSTFGLLSEGKGIEVALRAMATVAAESPEVRYVVAGRTHPAVVRAHGERYRDELLALVEELGLDKHVVFVDRFLSLKDLAGLLAITDVFCTPYHGKEQIVSGALTFALVAGCPVVSTPYRYASDVLANGAGILVPFKESDAMATAISHLLVRGPARLAAVTAANTYAMGMSWPDVGRTLRTVLANARSSAPRAAVKQSLGAAGNLDRDLSPTHLVTLCDDTAVFQHAELKVPRTEEGYCVDDAARLLPIAAHHVDASGGNVAWQSMLVRQMAFLRAAAREGDGGMRNFMSWDRRWRDRPHDGDHVGRSVWGLGELVGVGGPYAEEAHQLLSILAPRASRSEFSRNLAYTALGLVAADAASDPILRPSLELVHEALRAWQAGPERQWTWPEQRLSYDNARLPEALIRVGVHLGDDVIIARGVRMLSWLEDICNKGDHYRFVGHRGLSGADPISRSGDEQPLEATAMADAHSALLLATGDQAALRAIDRSWAWFLGNNRLRMVIGDTATGACFDGLGAYDVNRNCGAESTLAFHRCDLTRRTAMAQQAAATTEAAADVRP